MEVNKKISIFIPTFRRHVYLRKALDSVVSQARELNVDIYVSSNEIDVDTRKIVESFRYENLFYYENPQNIGIDLNMLKVLEYSKSQYCLMLGDDDLLIEGALLKLVAELDGEFCGVLLSGWNIDERANKLSRISHSELSSNLSLESSLVLENYWNKMHYGTLIINVPYSTRVLVEKFVGTKHAYSALPFLVNHQFKLPIKVSCIDSVLIRDGEKSYSSELAKVLLVECTQWLSLMEETHGEIASQVKHKYFKNEFSFLKLLKLFAQSKIVMNDFLEVPALLKIKIKLISLTPIPLRVIVVKFLLQIKKMVVQTRGESDVKSYF